MVDEMKKHRITLNEREIEILLDCLNDPEFYCEDDCDDCYEDCDAFWKKLRKLRRKLERAISFEREMKGVNKYKEALDWLEEWDKEAMRDE